MLISASGVNVKSSSSDRPLACSSAENRRAALSPREPSSRMRASRTPSIPLKRPRAHGLLALARRPFRRCVGSATVSGTRGSHQPRRRTARPALSRAYPVAKGFSVHRSRLGHRWAAAVDRRLIPQPCGKFRVIGPDSTPVADSPTKSAAIFLREVGMSLAPCGSSRRARGLQSARRSRSGSGGVDEPSRRVAPRRNRHIRAGA